MQRFTQPQQLQQRRHAQPASWGVCGQPRSARSPTAARPAARPPAQWPHGMCAAAAPAAARGGASSGGGVAPTTTELAQAALTGGFSGLARGILTAPGIEGDPLAMLRTTEAYWKALKAQCDEPHKKGPTVVTISSSSVHDLRPPPAPAHGGSVSRHPSFGAAPQPAPASPAAGANKQQQQQQQAAAALDFDVVLCGGTLGLLVALALQQRGHRVAVVERRRAEGRTQEWNTSMHELQVLVRLGLLTQAELDAAVVTAWDDMRIGFHDSSQQQQQQQQQQPRGQQQQQKQGQQPLVVQGVLNLGVCPLTLLASVRARFEALGGVVFEHTAFKSAVVCPDGVVATLASAAEAPADVGDVNRPTALSRQQLPAAPQQEQAQQHVRAMVPAAAAAGGGSNGRSASARQSTAGSLNNVVSINGRISHSGSNGAVSSRSSANGRSSNGTASSNHSNHSSSSNSSTTPPPPPSSGRPRVPTQLSCRLLLDCMGHYSPIVKQIRGRAKPEGMVLVVGSCATGFEPAANASGDLLYSISDAAADMQLFWEAFPAAGGAARTTYMFAYSDADQRRPSFESLLDAYFALLPAYQGLAPAADAAAADTAGDAAAGAAGAAAGAGEAAGAIRAALSRLRFTRVLFGGFPCYSRQPLAPAFDRVMQLGDASACQSPLSFGGFGSLLRHLPRLADGLSHALADERLSRADLSWLHGYQPSLSAAWLFQRAMSVGVGQLAPPARPPAAAAVASGSGGTQEPRSAAPAPLGQEGGSASGADSSRSSSSTRPAWLERLLALPAGHVNALLRANFAVMSLLGQRVLRPFLQDTLQLGPLAVTMAGMMLAAPLTVTRVLWQVGPGVVLRWFGHFAALVAYTVAHALLAPLRKQMARSYTLARLLDMLKFGSGSDFTAGAAGAGAGAAGAGAAAAAAAAARVATTAAASGAAVPAAAAAAGDAAVPVAAGEREPHAAGVAEGSRFESWRRHLAAAGQPGTDVRANGGGGSWWQEQGASAAALPRAQPAAV